MLTAREVEVMNLLIQGLNNKEISDRLSIATHTTKAHISHIYEKLKVSNRVQAAIKYYEFLKSDVKQEFSTALTK